MSYGVLILVLGGNPLQRGDDFLDELGNDLFGFSRVQVGVQFLAENASHVFAKGLLQKGQSHFDVLFLARQLEVVDQVFQKRPTKVLGGPVVQTMSPGFAVLGLIKFFSELVPFFVVRSLRLLSSQRIVFGIAKDGFQEPHLDANESVQDQLQGYDGVDQDNERIGKDRARIIIQKAREEGEDAPTNESRDPMRHHVICRVCQLFVVMSVVCVCVLN